MRALPFLLLLLPLLVLSRPGGSSGGFASPGRSKPKSSPNVLLLVTDDQRYDTIRALGDSTIQTPHLDRLVREGFAFTSSYVMGSLHGAVCMPSRAMLLTGQHYFKLPKSITVTWNVKKELRGNTPHPTLPELFRKANYTTFGTGKWHNGRRLFAKGFTHGEAIFFGGMHDHLKTPVYSFDPTGIYPAKRAVVGKKFSSELFADATIDFLKKRDRSRPFFAYVSFTAPHDPRMAPKRFADLYPPKEMPLPPNFMTTHPFPTEVLSIRDEKLGPYPRTKENVQSHIAGYYAMITHLDHEIGRILEALAQTGDGQDTIVVLVGDNGLAVGQHGLLGKQSVYEHSSRVPLVLRGPGIPVNQKSDALSYIHDLFPTLCDLTGIPLNQPVDAKSLAPILQGKQDRVRDSILLSFSESIRQEDGTWVRESHRAVRQGSLKLIRTVYRDRREARLFDLEKDPWELRDLSREGERKADRKRLEKLLVGWMRESKDPLDPEDLIPAQ